MGRPVSSTTAEIYEETDRSIYGTTPCKNLETICRWCLFHSQTYTLGKLFPTHQQSSSKFTMEEIRNGKLAFLDTLLKRNNGKVSVLVYRKPTHTNQYLYYSSLHQTSCNKSVVSPMFNRAHFIITNKDDLTKGSTWIKPLLKENGHQETINSKTFKRITNSHNLPQSHQQTQVTDIHDQRKRLKWVYPRSKVLVKHCGVFSDLTR